MVVKEGFYKIRKIFRHYVKKKEKNCEKGKLVKDL